MNNLLNTQTPSRRLMCILAHPDDEALGMGGSLAKYAAEGVEIYLLTATKGERGWPGPAVENPGLDGLGRIREQELLAAARILGIHQVNFLGYLDGDLDQVNPAEAIAQIVDHIRRVRPHVVVTFGPDGGYGHPDHIAISQLTAAAILQAANPHYKGSLLPDSPLPTYPVAKFYYKVWTAAEQEIYVTMFEAPRMVIDNVERSEVSWPDWAITTWIDTGPYWQVAWQAVKCHRSQLQTYPHIDNLTEQQLRTAWGREGYYRVFSLVNSGRQIEHDLFAGLPEN
jgi:LmbE family N-acetylglucosaminyl deacetylase